VKLVPYDASHEIVILRQIAEFFGFHHTLIEKTPSDNCHTTLNYDSRPTLMEWLVPPNALFVIVEADVAVGFIRINYRGPNVAWIEDVFVDIEHRGKGLASSAISAVEDIVKNVPGYTAICLDVSPRNTNAMRLYHKLGFTDLSLITVRKEFADSKRGESVHLLGLDFKY
jgi:RimJ/RimL family protein N-acetyltransferase